MTNAAPASAPDHPQRPAVVAAGRWGRWRRFGLGFAGVALGTAAWQFAAKSGLVNPVYLPPPDVVVARIPGLLIDGPLTEDIVASSTAIAYGVLIGHAIALPLAALAFRYRWLRDFVSPAIELVRGIAPLALLPAFLLLFGLGLNSAIAIIAWCAWVPLFLNLLEGLDSVDPILIRSARATGASTWKVVISVFVPGSLGHYLTGLRLAIGASWLAVVAAEMLGANAGLGFRIFEWSQVFRIADMYAAIIVIGMIGLIMNMGVNVAYRRALRWRLS